jgi:hypothetical protein
MEPRGSRAKLSAEGATSPVTGLVCSPMDIRRATEADLGLMRRLWDEFTAETTFTPYPGSPFEPVSSPITSRSLPKKAKGRSEPSMRT